MNQGDLLKLVKGISKDEMNESIPHEWKVKRAVDGYIKKDKEQKKEILNEKIKKEGKEKREMFWGGSFLVLMGALMIILGISWFVQEVNKNNTLKSLENLAALQEDFSQASYYGNRKEKSGRIFGSLVVLVGTAFLGGGISLIRES